MAGYSVYIIGDLAKFVCNSSKTLSTGMCVLKWNEHTSLI